MATLLKFVIPFLLFMAFAVSFIGFGLLLPELNGASQSISDDPGISAYANELNNTATDASLNSNIAEGVLGNSSITTGAQSNIIDSSQGIWKIITATPKTIWNLTFGLALGRVATGTEVLIILGIFGAILVLILVLAAYNFLARGEAG